MRAVVLVGGLGTRLRPLTLTRPKQLLPVAGTPMIERVLAHLAAHGVDHVVLSLGFMPDAFAEAYPDGRCAAVRLDYAVEPEPLGTAGGIAFAARHAGVAERFLVVNGDVLTGLDVAALVAFHDAAGAEATIALTPVENPTAFGVVPTDGDGRVLAFIEPSEAVKKGLEAPAEPPPTNLVNAGYYVLEPSVLDRVPAGASVNVEREVFPAMVAERTLFARADEAYWIDVGTPERYLTACADAAGTDAVVEPGAAVASSASLLSSVVLPGAIVQDRASLLDTVVGEGAWIGAGASLRGCVIGDGARVEPGATLAGARIPEG